MNEDLLYSILQFVPCAYDYSELFSDPLLRIKCKTNFRDAQLSEFNTLIEEHFSRLYYLHIIAGPPTQNEVDRVFSSMDYHGLFQRPAYYDISVYIKMFDEFDIHALPCYMTQQQYPYHYTFTKPKYKKITPKFKTTLLESITLC